MIIRVLQHFSTNEPHTQTESSQRNRNNSPFYSFKYQGSLVRKVKSILQIGTLILIHKVRTGTENLISPNCTSAFILIQ